MGFPGSLTLKKRIVIVFTLGTLLPFLATVLVSYLTITSIQTNQIEGRIRTNLAEVQWNLQNSLDNLNHVSQQLALEGSIGNQLERYYQSSDAYERASLRDRIKAEIALVSYTNPNVGLMMYTFPDGSHDFENLPGVEAALESDRPLLGRHYQIAYFGPHRSRVHFTDRIVLSAVRLVDNPGFPGLAVYLETGFKLTETILDAGNEGPEARYLFLDADRRITYSEVPDDFPLGQALPAPHPQVLPRTGYVWNEVTNRQGWTLVSLVREADFHWERDRWIGAVLMLFLLFAVLGTLLGSLLWKTIYKPLGVFQKEMRWIETLDAELPPVVPVKIPEFDHLLVQFQEMKTKILSLMTEAQAKERLRADLEIEKLVYQINPHFLLNALNTVHWLAVVHRQPEIDRFTGSLTRLLSYNLGKLGRLGTIREEIDALQDYVTMQRVRFDLQFVPRIEVEDHRLDTPLPRFTLQPLVENAIHHGLGDDGFIGLLLTEDEEGLHLTVEDTGPGIPSVEASPDSRGFDMGIGLTYVRRILEFHYGGRARLDLDPRPGRGTRVTIVLPLEPGDRPW